MRKLSGDHGFLVPALVIVVLAVGAGSRSAEAQVPKVVRYELDARSLVDGSKEELSSVRELRSIPSGGVSFTDVGEPVLRLFGRDGQSLGTIGSRGSGPGEVRYMIGGHGWLADTVWVSDRDLRRTTFFLPDGKLLRTVPWPRHLVLSTARGETEQHMRAPVPVSYLSLGHFLMEAYSERLNPVSVSISDGPEYALFKTDSSGVVLNEIFHAKRTRACEAQWSDGTNGMSGSFWIPYCALHVVAISPGGSRAVLAEQGGELADGQARLLVKDSNGKTLADVTLALTTTRIPGRLVEAEIAKIARTGPASSSPGRRAALDRMPRAKVFPAFGRVLIADDGVVWLQRWIRSGAERWIRVHPERDRAVESVKLPTGFRPAALWSNGIWGVIRDAEDVPSIVFASKRQ